MGRPRAPDALIADKAYDADAFREDLKKRAIRPVILPTSDRIKTIRYSKRLYRERDCIERMFGHLKINRAIATRYDQLADSFLGMLFLASARYTCKNFSISGETEVKRIEKALMLPTTASMTLA